MSEPSVICSNCGARQNFATEERLIGSALGFVSVNADDSLSFEHTGYTEINYDSSTTTGYECRSCGLTKPTLEDLVDIVEILG